MRFIHTGDWHLGRRLQAFSLLEDQEHMLKQEFLPLVRDEGCQAVVLAGDVYDRAVADRDAVALFDEVLTRLWEMQVKVFVIAGNHDSGTRLGFGSRLYRPGIFVRGEYSAAAGPVTLEDEYGPVDFALLPYITPADVRQAWPETDGLRTYDEATGFALARLAGKIPAGRRSVLVAHAFVAGRADTAGAGGEELAAGGLDNVAPERFAAFSYTALGHLHSPRPAGRPDIWYSGSPLKYSLKEAAKPGEPSLPKAVLSVELSADGTAKVAPRELQPRRDVRCICGELEELLQLPPSEDYLEVRLTDEREPLGSVPRLRKVFPHLCSMHWLGRSRAEAESVPGNGRRFRGLDIEAQFLGFMQQVAGRSLDLAEHEALRRAIRETEDKEREARAQ